MSAALFDTIDFPRMVITRKVDQEIVLHDCKGFLGKIRIYQIRGGQVKIAFEADKRLKINRKEQLIDKQ